VRTDDLIDRLAADRAVIPAGAVQRRFVGVAVAGALAALVLVLAWLGTRQDLAQAMTGRMFWMKAPIPRCWAWRASGRWSAWRGPRRAAQGAAVRGGGAGAVRRHGVRPMAGRRPEHRRSMMMGGSWKVCFRYILTLALPGLAATLLVLRGMAPTRPALAGFAAGAFAGGVAATIYGLHCGESTMVFVGTWYTMGVLGTGVLGAVIGKWALRW
jgi:hypothetical protein